MHSCYGCALIKDRFSYLQVVRNEQCQKERFNRVTSKELAITVFALVAPHLAVELYWRVVAVRDERSFVHKYRLPPDFTVRNQADFELIYAQSTLIKTSHFHFYKMSNSVTHPRLALAIAKRLTGNAICRNYVRRRLKECFRLSQHDLSACDILVKLKRPVRALSRQQLNDLILRAWNLFCKRLEPS